MGNTERWCCKEQLPIRLFSSWGLDRLLPSHLEFVSLVADTAKVFSETLCELKELPILEKSDLFLGRMCTGYASMEDDTVCS